MVLVSTIIFFVLFVSGVLFVAFNDLVALFAVVFGSFLEDALAAGLSSSLSLVSKLSARLAVGCDASLLFFLDLTFLVCPMQRSCLMF